MHNSYDVQLQENGSYIAGGMEIISLGEWKLFDWEDRPRLEEWNLYDWASGNNLVGRMETIWLEKLQLFGWENRNYTAGRVEAMESGSYMACERKQTNL